MLAKHHPGENDPDALEEGKRKDTLGGPHCRIAPAAKAAGDQSAGDKAVIDQPTGTQATRAQAAGVQAFSKAIPKEGHN